jgi:hypothetical protein
MQPEQIGLHRVLPGTSTGSPRGLAHRVLVMRGGKTVAELTGDDVTESAILGAAFGTEASRGDTVTPGSTPVLYDPYPSAAKEVPE